MKISVRVLSGKFKSVDLTIAIIEGLQNDRGAELAFDDQMGRLFVITIDTRRQAVENFLLHA